MTDPSDRADPAVRAATRFDHAAAHERATRITTGCLLAAAAVAAPFAAEPITGDPGAAVGAVVGAALLLALACAVWPYEWSAAERKHRELESIWRELRTDADAQVPWKRYGVWAESSDGSVDIVLITCAAAATRVRGAPSPYKRETARRLAADDLAEAAEAMEELRANASRREFQSQQYHFRSVDRAEREAHQQALDEIDTAAATYQKELEKRAEREQAEQDAAEQRAQAEALARALRRP